MIDWGWLVAPPHPLSKLVSSVLCSIDLVATHRAPILHFEPLLDAARVELMEASQRQNLLALLVIRHANHAMVLVWVHGAHVDGAFRRILRVTRQRQLGEQVCIYGFDVVTHVELIHVVFELLFCHVVDSLVNLLLVAARVASRVEPVAEFSNGWPNFLVKLADCTLVRHQISHLLLLLTKS